MSGARERILQGIGRALRGQGDAAGGLCGDELQQARKRALGDMPAPRPEWTQALTERFLERLVAASGSYAHAANERQVVAAVVEYLDSRELPRELHLAAHPRLQRLPWPAALVRHDVASAADARVAMSAADAATAETGTLVLCSGPETPSSLNLLPEHHLVLVRRADVVAHMEDVWDRLRAGESFPARAVHFITGPSRTADVEQTIQLGAHGPRALHVVLLTEDD